MAIEVALILFEAGGFIPIIRLANLAVEVVLHSLPLALKVRLLLQWLLHVLRHRLHHHWALMSAAFSLVIVTLLQHCIRLGRHALAGLTRLHLERVAR